MVCEKPDSAKKVSNALSGGRAKQLGVDGTAAFEFLREGERYVVASSQGHVYALSDPFSERSVFPVFDVEWYPMDAVDKKDHVARRRISAFRKLAAHATKFVNACDFDAEGETIGFNVLTYACSTDGDAAYRAKFSTLTENELVGAFNDAERGGGSGLAEAGRARHMIDFVWGINFSRALSSLARDRARRRTLSVGRVQGPTLDFLVQREKEIREFVPLPFWSVHLVLEKGGETVTMEYADRVETKLEAEEVRDDCLGSTATVVSVARAGRYVPPPPPFNTGDLQREAYRAFGFSASRTLAIAERLYLDGLTSYPRTASQRVPPTVGYESVLRNLAGIARYSRDAEEVLRNELKPTSGPSQDRAHPAIYPTGERPRGSMESSEAKVYDLVVKRFMSAFGPAAKVETTTLEVEVNGHMFRLSSQRTAYLGWMKHSGRQTAGASLPEFLAGEKLGTVDVQVAERFHQSPPRFNDASLIEKMEREGIGTKSTRAGIISVLAERGYIEGPALEATELGFLVADAMHRYAPSLTSPALTLQTERRLEKVEAREESEASVVREAVRSIVSQLVSFEDGEGFDVPPGTVGADSSLALGPCPVCRAGTMRVVRSKKTKKRFVGCSRYVLGCTASAPLPQRGRVRRTSKPCSRCSWPVISLVRGGYRRQLCVNPACSGRKGD